MLFRKEKLREKKKRKEGSLSKIKRTINSPLGLFSVIVIVEVDAIIYRIIFSNFSRGAKDFSSQNFIDVRLIWFHKFINTSCKIHFWVLTGDNDKNKIQRIKAFSETQAAFMRLYRLTKEVFQIIIFSIDFCKNDFLKL